MSKRNRERRQQRRKASGHLEAVLAASQERLAEGLLQPGQLYTVAVAHDDWCDLLAGRGPCNCNPEVGRPQRIPVPEEN
jgi:hypothetical protein